MDIVAGLKLDADTLVFSIAVLGCFMAAISFSLDHGSKGCGLGKWGVAMACNSASFLLFFFHASGPWFLTFVVANIFIMASVPFALGAFADLLRTRIRPGTAGCIVALGLSGVFAVYLLGVSRRFSIFSISVAIAIEYGMVVWMILKLSPRPRSALTAINALTIGVMAATFAARAVLAVSNANASITVLPAANSAPQISALVIGALFLTLATIGFISMTNERQQTETLDRLRRDGLTGLYTRTAFIDMEQQFENGNSAYAVIIFDLDHFKSINDRFGHAGGDSVLAHAARLVSSSIRISDIAVRYGGEEFCVLMQDCSRQQAESLAARVIKEASRQTVRLRSGEEASYTFSAGSAWRPARPTPQGQAPLMRDVIEQADRALYLAKNATGWCRRLRGRRQNTWRERRPRRQPTAAALQSIAGPKEKST